MPILKEKNKNSRSFQKQFSELDEIRMKVAVMICNMGGPSSLEEVEPYLLNIFSDPDIIDIPLPGLFRMKFVRWLVRKRVPKSKEIYQKIGGKTPLNEIAKGSLLENQLAVG